MNIFFNYNRSLLVSITPAWISGIHSIHGDNRFLDGIKELISTHLRAAMRVIVISDVQISIKFEIYPR